MAIDLRKNKTVNDMVYVFSDKHGTIYKCTSLGFGSEGIVIAHPHPSFGSSTFPIDYNSIYLSSIKYLSNREADSHMFYIEQLTEEIEEYLKNK